MLAVLDADCHSRIGALGVGLRVSSCQLGFVVLQDLCSTSSRLSGSDVH